MEEKKWEGTTYGSSLMHRWLIRLLRVTDVRVVYVFAYLFVIPPCLFLPGYRFIYRYFRQRWGMGAVRACWNTYLNHCMFAQVVIDRFAMYAGKRFRMDIDGNTYFQALSDRPDAFVQLSSHIGNYEMAGYTLAARKPLNALVYGGEKQSVMENRSNMFAGNNIRMIPVRQDMSHLFLIDSALQRGEIVSMPADRMLGSQKYVATTLLATSVRLPQGPFSVAAMRGLEVLTVHVMKKSAKHYMIYVTPLHYDKQAPRHQQIAQLAQGYAAELERMLTMYPTQWYNFYDFWYGGSDS